MYNAAVWLREIERQQGEHVNVRWRSFPLEQVNQTDSGWQFWEQRVEDARSLLAFLAAEAAGKQSERFKSLFIFALVDAVHKDKKRIHEIDTIRSAASHVPGLDCDKLLEDVEDNSNRKQIATDYTEGADGHGVFGTPTLLFPGGEAVFLKMDPPPPEDAVLLLESLKLVSVQRPYVRELKKPRPPERSQ
ncbi:MAG: hypothetical protein NVSMB52_16770 [Chloroflexota bacterium]